MHAHTYTHEHAYTYTNTFFFFFAHVLYPFFFLSCLFRMKTIIQSRVQSQDSQVTFLFYSLITGILITLTLNTTKV